MLQNAPRTTGTEGFWEGDVKTLFELIEIQKINPPFHFTKLKKLSGGEAISPDYSRSYCMVQAVD